MEQTSRKSFLRTAGGSAVVAGLGATLAACGSSKKELPKATALGPVAQFGPGDVGILNYVLSLEHLEVAFYKAAVASGKLTGKTLALAKQLGAEEQRHVTALGLQVAKLGGKPVKPQKAAFPLSTERGVLDTASTLENLGAGAYLGQLASVQSQEVLALLLSIHTVEGRHAAAIEDALGHPVTPNGPFAKPITAEDAQGQIQTYLAG
jgi:hypothetical protein